MPVDSALAEKCKFILSGGWYGVDLFFVLSGFLITGILLDTRTSPNYFRPFYIRRILRIFPVYYATLTIVLIAACFFPVFNSVLPPPYDRTFYFFYLNNWWVFLQGGWQANIIGHFWSLAVEEQFYLVWPLLLWRSSLKHTKAFATGGIILAPIIRIAIYAKWGVVRDIVENPFCRTDSLLMGALLASLVRDSSTTKRWQPVLPWMFLAAAVAIVAGSASDVTVLKLAHSRLFISTGLALTFGGLIARVFQSTDAQTPLQRILRIRALRCAVNTAMACISSTCRCFGWLPTM